MSNLNFKKIFYLLFFNCFFAGIFLNLSAQVVDFSEVYQKTVLGAVFIATDSGCGSGFQINSDGYIVTNHHVIEDAQGSSIRVYFYSGEKFFASIIASNPVVDLALLKIQANNNGVIPILPTGDVPIGSAVMAIGTSKIDNFFSQQPGSVNNLDRYKIHHNASITFGFSGGPLINQEGFIVGVNCSILNIEKERNFAIKASHLRNFLLSVGVNYSTQSLGISQPGTEYSTGITFKFGVGGKYYMFPIEALKRFTESWMIQASIGYRLGVNPKTNRGQIVGLFAIVGNLNNNGIRSALDREGEFKNINLYKELEAGFVFRERFRLTAGGGMQDIHFAYDRTETLKYFSVTSGLSMRIGTAFEWDVNATFMFPGESMPPSYRINTSLNFRFNAFRL